MVGDGRSIQASQEFGDGAFEISTVGMKGCGYFGQTSLEYICHGCEQLNRELG